MINTALKNNKQSGFVTLAVTLVLLMVLTLVSLFTATALVTEQQVSSNVYRAEQSFAAAQAGVGFGINYLNANKTTVTDGQVITGTMADGSSYSVQFNFVGGNNQTVELQSTGVSADNSGTRTVKQTVKFLPLIPIVPNRPMTARGNGDMKGNSEIRNLENNITILLGGNSMKIGGNGKTKLSSGVSSNKKKIGPDIIKNDATISAMNDATFEQSMLGTTVSKLASSATTTYSGSGNKNYSSQLNGVTGSVIYINNPGGTVSINGNTTIGSSSSPVTIVVSGNVHINGNVTLHGNILVTNGTLRMNGNSTVNGLVYSSGDLEMGNGNMDVNGAIISGGDFSLSGNGSLNYDSSILNQAQGSAGIYGKVSGSWQDLNN